MGNRGQKRAEIVEDLPADKRTCSSLEFRPGSSSVSPNEATPSTSQNQTHDHDMETSSSASGSGSGRTDEDKDSAYGSCDSDDMGDTEHRKYRHALLDYQRQRLSGDQTKFKRVLSILNGEIQESTLPDALRELCEILSFCTDSSLSSLMANSLSPILIKLAGIESNPEIMLLSIRALTYLCDINPRSSAFIVSCNGVPALCQRLLSIEYEDVAEQCLQALEKISREQPLACLQSGAIMAVLTYIDFFSTSVQRVALSTVVNICEKLPSEGFSPFMDAVPILCQLLQYEDNQLVEHVATCLIKIAERVHQSPEMLDELSKHGLIHQVAHLIDSNSKTTLSHSVDTGLVGLLVKLATGSMTAVRTLFDLNISSILKDILSTYDLSHNMPSPRAVGQSNQVHEVLKLLIQLLPVVARNHEVPLAEEKATFLVNSPNLTQKFGNDLLHVLIQVVDSGVDLYICYGCLCVIDKLIYYINSDTLLDLLKQTNISRFLAGVFTRKDRHVIMLALNISETILQKNNDVFVDPFVKEGVLFAIDALIVPEKGSNFMFSMFNDIQLSNSSSRKQCLCYSFDNCKSSSASESLNCKLEGDCLQTLAKNIRTNYFDKNASTSANGTTDILEKLKSFSVELASMMTRSMVEEEYDHVLHQIMSHLNGSDVISTFEFVESGITESLFKYLSSGECSRRVSDSNVSKGQHCIVERRLKTFVRLFWSNFSLSEFISKLQSGLSSVEDYPVVLSSVSKHRNSYATVPYRRCTTYPCLKVLFEKGDGESTLIDYSGDVQNVDPFSDFDAIEKFLWPKVYSESNKDEENGPVTIQNNVEQTSAESSCRNEIPSDSMEHDQNAVEKDSSISTEHTQSCRNDCHLSFYLEGKQIDQGLTLYQAVIRHHKAQYDTVTHAALWNETHRVTYKKTSKLEKIISRDCGCQACWPSSLKKLLFSEIGSAVEKPTACYNLLFLLRILEAVNRFWFHIMSHEKINAFAQGIISDLDGIRATNEGILGIVKNEFINSRLTEKLEQQMRDPLAISTGSMPSWFLAGVFTRKDRHVIMLALNISETILQKNNDVFVDPFVKEGVLFAIDALIVPEKGSNFMFSMFNDIQLSNSSSRKQCLCYSFDNCKSSSASESLNCKLEGDCLQTLAKNIRTNYFDKNASTSANGTTDILEKLKSFSVELASMMTRSMVEEEYDHVLHQIMSHLNGSDVISTFEFVESGITESLFKYLSSGECSRRVSDSNVSKGQHCIVERRLKTFVRLFWSNFSLSEFISKLQSGLSSVEDYPVVLSSVSKHRNSYATVPYRRCTTYPCLKVLFEKGDGESTLIDYSGDVQNVDPFSDFDAIEKFLWPKVYSESNKDEENGPVTIQNNVEQTSAESSCRNEIPSVSSSFHDSMEHDQNAVEKDSSISTKDTQSCRNDCHLSFYLEGKQMDQGLTLYQAVIRHHKAQYDTVTHAALWNETHRVTYKKTSKLEKIISRDCGCQACWPSSLKKLLFSEIGSAVEKPTACYNLLFLLRILEAVNRFWFHIMSHEKINAFAQGIISDLDGIRATNDGILGIVKNEFINSRLTEKLEQQMRDPLAISTGSMPSWCTELMASCPFLFSFEARCKYFRLAAFGKPQGQTRISSGSNSGIQNDSPMPRKKFLVYRHQILESAAKMMDLHANQKVVLEVKYDEEVGTGLGPTLEFFTLVSNEFQKPGLGMWRGDNFSDTGIVGSLFGLFPGPWCPSVSVSNDIEFSEVKRKFLLLGQIVAKALHDGRVLDLPLSKAFYKLILGQELTLYDIQSFDPVLGKTLIEFQALVERRKYVESVGEISANDLDPCFRDTKIHDLHLDFTLPGYPDYILASGPDKEMVDSATLEEYIELVVDATINSGISRQMDAFKMGFNQVFPINNLQIFTDEELERLLCGESVTIWNSNQLSDLIKFDHGYTASSPPVLHFLEVIQEFDYEQQKAFVKFVTGAPRLPLGGLASLNPKLTIVRKHCDKVVDADLPSAMTCANYLKLPPYSSKETMKEKLLYAITEGQGSFHLS
ncbi:hypothetical protein SSX86_012599 [Deinandra increscens subsp. villosa]|uniref:HECT-type E3 ubiquitin transferase n=1 Tax=Deinandra increscens subsp. villosa TaxID=3103831 RepID=A0AAP0D4I5_9ASTR